jgi:hypothetical protein
MVKHATGARDVFHAMNLNQRRSGDLQPRGDGNRCRTKIIPGYFMMRK